MITPKAGGKVRIYQRPHSKKDEEGIAILKKRKISSLVEEGFDRWWVKFGPYDPIVLRTFALDDVISSPDDSK